MKKTIFLLLIFCANRLDSTAEKFTEDQVERLVAGIDEEETPPKPMPTVYVPFQRLINKISQSTPDSWKFFRINAPFTAAVALNFFLSRLRNNHYSSMSRFDYLSFSKWYDENGNRIFTCELVYDPDAPVQGPEKSLVETFNAAQGEKFCGSRIMDQYTTCIRSKFSDTQFKISCTSHIPDALYRAAINKYEKDTNKTIDVDR